MQATQRSHRLVKAQAVTASIPTQEAGPSTTASRDAQNHAEAKSLLQDDSQHIQPEDGAKTEAPATDAHTTESTETSAKRQKTGTLHEQEAQPVLEYQGSGDLEQSRPVLQRTLNILNSPWSQQLGQPN